MGDGIGETDSLKQAVLRGSERSWPGYERIQLWGTDRELLTEITRYAFSQLCIRAR